MSQWYLDPDFAPHVDWQGPDTREHKRASEGPFALNLPPELITVTPEESQAAELDWNVTDDPFDPLFYWNPLNPVTDPSFYWIPINSAVSTWTDDE